MTDKSVLGTRLAMFRVVKTSPAPRPMIWFGGTRESEQPMYLCSYIISSLRSYLSALYCELRRGKARRGGNREEEIGNGLVDRKSDGGGKRTSIPDSVHSPA